MKPKTPDKVNYALIIAGLVMIAASALNYSFNDDHVSLGVFIFAGAGFIMLGFAPAYEKKTSKRMLKYAYLFFTIALLILAYWFVHGKLGLF